MIRVETYRYLLLAEVTFTLASSHNSFILRCIFRAQQTVSVSVIRGDSFFYFTGNANGTTDKLDMSCLQYNVSRQNHFLNYALPVFFLGVAWF
jgi:acid phosphatase class B